MLEPDDFPVVIKRPQMNFELIKCLNDLPIGKQFEIWLTQAELRHAEALQKAWREGFNAGNRDLYGS